MSVLVEVHSVLRWLVLLAAVAALAVALLAGTRGGLRAAVRPAVATYAGVMTLQFLLGVAVWLAQGRWDGDNPFFSWIHPTAMLLALGAAHAGMARVRRAGSGADARRAALLFTTVSLLLALIAIPW